MTGTPRSTTDAPIKCSNYYQIFNFDGSFLHESKSRSATPQLHEVMNQEHPERVQLTVRAEDSQEVFEIIAELKIVRIQDHRYERNDTQSRQRNLKDARKNKKFLGHLKQYQSQSQRNKAEEEEAMTENVPGTPINQWG
jgi:hypothetical protein